MDTIETAISAFTKHVRKRNLWGLHDTHTASMQLPDVDMDAAAARRSAAGAICDQIDELHRRDGSTFGEFNSLTERLNVLGATWPPDLMTDVQMAFIAAKRIH